MAGERNVVARNVNKVVSVSKAREETVQGCQGQGGDIAGGVHNLCYVTCPGKLYIQRRQIVLRPAANPFSP